MLWLIQPGDSSLGGTGAHWGLLFHLESTRTLAYILCCKAPSQHSITPQPEVVHGFAPSQVQDLTFLFVELSEVPVGLFPQHVKSPWMAVKPPAHSELPPSWHYPQRCLPGLHPGQWWRCVTPSRPVTQLRAATQHWPPAKLQLINHSPPSPDRFSATLIPRLPGLATAPLLPVNISAVLWLRKHCKHLSAEIRGRRAGLFPSLCCVTFSKWPKPQRTDATCCLNKSAYATDCRCSCIWGKTLCETAELTSLPTTGAHAQN